MIASENFVPRAVLQAQGSVLTNKYAEGYPGRRYYGGCENVDVIEDLARNRAKELFGAEFANVQPHSGAQANAAVLMALMTPGEKLLGLDLAHGGHLTHGMKLNFSGKLYDVASYGVSEEDHRIDMDEVRDIALREKPKVIVAGWSAYPRHEDFAAFRAIADEVGAYLWVDMAHFAGLVAAGLHPSPVPVRGRRLHDRPQDARWSALGPDPREEGVGQEAQLRGVPRPAGRTAHARHRREGRLLEDRRAATSSRTASSAPCPVRGSSPTVWRSADVADKGISVLTGGTDVHLVLVDLRNSQLDGQQGEDLLHEVGITVNRNAVPFDPRPPMVTSGLRIGTPALATRGFGDAQFTEVADIIAQTLVGDADKDAAAGPREQARAGSAAVRGTRGLEARLTGSALTQFSSTRPLRYPAEGACRV